MEVHIQNLESIDEKEVHERGITKIWIGKTSINSTVQFPMFILISMLFGLVTGELEDVL